MTENEPTPEPAVVAPEPASDVIAQAPAPTVVAPSFRALFEREGSYVWNSLKRLGVQDRDLEDLSHEVFITVHRRLADYDPARPLRPWLFGICLRTAMRYRELARHRREVMGDEVDAADDRPNAEALLQRKQAQ